MVAVAAVLDPSNGTQERKGKAGLGKLLTSVRARLLSLRSVKGADGGSTLVGSWLPSWSPLGVNLYQSNSFIEALNQLRIHFTLFAGI
jgi:hypothetical protein